MLATVNPKFCVAPVLWVTCILCFVAGHIVKRNTPPSSTDPSDGNEIHCYCNLPSCITSSYMCRSQDGCFKRFDPIGQFHYGCVDLTTKEVMCSKPTERNAEQSPNSPAFVDQCCFTDMCNHESVENSNLISTYNLSLNESNDDLRDSLSAQTTYTLYPNSEIWFRAFLIAVPICGVTILVLLILIAIRLLRSEGQEGGMGASKLIKKNYEIAAVAGDKLPQTPVAETYDYNLGNSFKSTKYTLLERKFPFVFGLQSQQRSDGNRSGGKCVKYQGFVPKHKYVVDGSTNVHHILKISDKFKRQNLNILKLPHKFNDLKQKSDINANANFANINRGYIVSNYPDSVTVVHSYPNFNVSDSKKDHFIH